MIFPRISSDSKSSQGTGTFLNILADLNNAVVWMVSICPLISKFSSSFTNPLEIVPNVPITIGITITIMFHSYLVLLQGLDFYLSFAFF